MPLQAGLTLSDRKDRTEKDVLSFKAISEIKADDDENEANGDDDETEEAMMTPKIQQSYLYHCTDRVYKRSTNSK